MEKIINQKMFDVFSKLGFDTQFAVVKYSDRPDLSDFQCNGAMPLAGRLKQNPRQIASQIAQELEKEDIFASVSVDGPGFINIKLQDGFIASHADLMNKDERLLVDKVADKKRQVIDYGGPNVAKAMHVGHLRSGVIGECIRRINCFVGHDVISDVHFGDWGTPIGMIISQVIADYGNLDKLYEFDVEQITQIYKKANVVCKDNEQAKETARIITAQMQSGHEEYYKAWKYIRDVSVEDVKKNYLDLDVNFDLWWGESDAHQTCYKIIEIAKEKGLAEEDDGALIIRLDQSNKPKPPVILRKSDGGFTYHTTDIATIYRRVNEFNTQEMVYFTDQRQSLHFEQVFEAVEKLGIAPNVKFTHIGFGTVNGPDGKPFKTRDGGVMNLSDLISLSKQKVAESMPSETEVSGYTSADISKMTDQIAIAAIKFQDLKNNIASGYIFETENFAKFEGKTGPYIQYAIARINSVCRKAKEKGLAEANIVVSNRQERDLLMNLSRLSGTVHRSAVENEPSLLADYAYNIAQMFSSFYNASPILSISDNTLAGSRLKMCVLVGKTLKLLLNLLGIQAPEVMLKKEA